MSLLQRIKTDQLSARKARDKFKTSILTTLLSEASRPGLDDGKRESIDSEVVGVVKKFIKGMKESLDINYTDAIHHELCIVSEYLPVQLTTEELTDVCGGLFKVNPDINMGQAMGWFKKRFDGKYDGKQLSEVVRKFI